jgi:hypothetical protein
VAGHVKLELDVAPPPPIPERLWIYEFRYNTPTKVGFGTLFGVKSTQICAVLARILHIRLFVFIEITGSLV